MNIYVRFVKLLKLISCTHMYTKVYFKTHSLANTTRVS